MHGSRIFHETNNLASRDAQENGVRPRQSIPQPILEGDFNTERHHTAHVDDVPSPVGWPDAKRQQNDRGIPSCGDPR